MLAGHTETTREHLSELERGKKENLLKYRILLFSLREQLYSKGEQSSMGQPAKAARGLAVLGVVHGR